MDREVPADAGPDRAPIEVDVDVDDRDASTERQPVTSLPEVCPTGECDLVHGGCQEGFSCQMLTLEDGRYGPFCQPSGEFAEGAPCENYMDCAPGLTCIPDDTGKARCRSYCCGNSDPCQQERKCSLFLQSPEGNLSSAALCMPANNCEPRSSESCGGDRGCYLSVNSLGRFDGNTQCLESPAGLPEGTACTRGNDCSPGHQCLNEFCRRFCSTLGSDCWDAQECLPLSVPTRPTLGFCQTPT